MKTKRTKIKSDTKSFEDVTEALTDIQNSLENIWFLLEKVVRIETGTGTPENSIVADRGTIYLRLDGGTDTTLYVKESTDGKSSGWVAK